MQDELEEAQKSFTIRVPDFALNNGVPMTSYIRLGSAGPSVDPGGDLVGKFGGFIDDHRVRDSASETPDQRQLETGRLTTKGGWRDHTDGNRVTTTRGDKLEVIRGNYTMLVLGRQEDANDGAFSDVSGGIAVNGDRTPGGITEVKWVQTHNGTWKVIENSYKGDTFTRYCGNAEEEFFGDIIKSTIGSATPGATTAPVNVEMGGPTNRAQAPNPATNPAITERTWASSISSYRGSSACYVPTIVEETYATTLTETTTVSGTLTSTTSVSTLTETTTATTSVTSTVTAPSLTENVNVSGTYTVNLGTAGNPLGRLETTTHYSSALEEMWGYRTAIGYGGTNELWFGGFFELFIGGNASIRVASSAEVSIAAAAEVFILKSFEIFIGSKFEFNFGSGVAVRLGPSFTFESSPEQTINATIKKRTALAILLG